MIMPTGFMITAVIVVILVFRPSRSFPNTRLVVLRLGKVLERPKGPGIVILIRSSTRPCAWTSGRSTPRSLTRPASRGQRVHLVDF